MTYKIKHKPGKKEQMKSYINCGKSVKAIEAAEAVFATLGNIGGLDAFQEKQAKQAMATAAVSIGMRPNGSLSWSDTAWYHGQSDWKKIGDLSELEPLFKVHEIKLNSRLVARVHEDYIDVSETDARCTIIENERVKAVYHRIMKNEEGRNQED